MAIVVVFALLALFSIVSIVMSAGELGASGRPTGESAPLGDARPPLGAPTA